MLIQIQSIKSREVLNSRRFPALEVDVILKDGSTGTASIPSGTSKGAREAKEVIDSDHKRYRGSGVKCAIKNIAHYIAPELEDYASESLEDIDKRVIELDGTPNKEKLGANACLGVSLATLKALAAASGRPLFDFLGNRETYTLPTPLMNIMGKGSHTDSKLDFQDFIIIPAGASNFSEATEFGIEVFHSLKDLLHKAGILSAICDTGCFAPILSSNEEAIEYIIAAIEKAGLKPGKDIFLGLDMASSSSYRNGKYFYRSENRYISTDQLIDRFEKLVHDYPIISIEDGLSENDWQGWHQLTQRLGQKVQLVGDDLFTTNVSLLKEGIAAGIANSILIKPNQIGTITETLLAIEESKASKYQSIFSVRAGETEDVSLADLAVALDVHQIKLGSISSADKLLKINQLLRIESELGTAASFAGYSPYQNLSIPTQMESIEYKVA